MNIYFILMSGWARPCLGPTAYHVMTSTLGRAVLCHRSGPPSPARPTRWPCWSDPTKSTQTTGYAWAQPVDFHIELC